MSQHVSDRVDDYVHGLLGPEEAERVERHCAGCASCAAALDAARRLRKAVRNVPPAEARPELVRATLDRVEDYERRSRRRRLRLLWSAAAAIAASIALLAGAQVYFHRLTPPPTDLLVLGQNELLANTSSSLRIRLTDHAKNQPLANVPVTVELIATKDQSKKVELAKFTTDAAGVGQPRFDVPDWEDGQYELCITAATPEKPEVLTRKVELKRSWQVMLSSDKPVYKPGQEIQVRALALRRPDLKPIAEQPAVFTITDPKGNVIFKKKAPTSRFGITSADCPLADELIEGAYVIACKLGDSETKLQVQVMKYVLPKFEITLEPDRTYYRPGDKVRCVVKAKYFFGKPVAGATVELMAFTSMFGQLQRQAAAPLKTNDQGEAVYETVLPAGNLGGLDDTLTFAAHVTDTAGQIQERVAKRPVTSSELKLEVIPEGGVLVKDVPNTVYVLTTRADGTPANVRLTVSGVLEELRTGELGVASFSVTPTADAIALQVRATDDKGAVLARYQHTLSCGRAERDFLLRTDKAVYTAGQPMKLTVLGGGSEPVFVDFVREGKDRNVFRSETIPVTDGKGELTHDLPPDLFGTVQLYAYRFGVEGVAIHKSRVVYINPPGELKIRTTLDRDEYRPGTKGKISFALTDSKGNPTPGALSLAAVDEAVFAVLAQAPGSERSFYLMDQQLLEPVRSRRPWTPTPLPPIPRDLPILEKALFSCTARSAAVASAPVQGKKSVGAVAMPEPAVDVAPGMGLPAPRVAQATSPAGTQNVVSPHSLTAESWKDKATYYARLRREGLDWVIRGWIALGILVVLAGYLSLWALAPTREVLKIHAVALIMITPVAALILVVSLGSEKAATFDTVATAVGAAGGAAMERQAADRPRAAPMAPGAADLTNVDMGMDKESAPKPADAPRPRLRQQFPETLLWRPELITDEQGRASIDLELADSITTWRLSSSAVAADGRLGSAQLPVKVFQPFFVELNLPLSLTRGDETAVPVVVYNYLDRPQTVTLTLADADWFERLEGDAMQKLELTPNEVRSLSYRVRVKKVGEQKLKVEALGSGVSDAIQRPIEVLPDGRRVELVANGSLSSPAEHAIAVPEEAIEGSVRATLKIYPTSFSQLVEGLDNIFRMPYGCFEQTSSTTYPNVLALEYLKKTGQTAPAVEAKARQYIHLGYQRLLTFEVAGGGFDWFGRPPANRVLTAYGLMEFEDMARVHEVDPNLIQRTRRWLLRQRASSGSWTPEGHALHEDPTHGGGDGRMATLAATAYIAWAVFASDEAASDASRTREFLLSHKPDEIKDPHVLALVANALLVLDRQGQDAAPYLDRLDALKRTGDNGRLVWWEQEQSARTMFHGAGRSGSVETTALATLALLRGQKHRGSVRGALAWLVAQKDGNGTWYSTQATVLALKALLAGTEKPTEEKERRIQVKLGDNFTREIVIPADHSEVLYQLNLTRELAAGRQVLELKETSGTNSGYQVSVRYHVPAAKPKDDTDALQIQVDYDRTEVPVNGVVQATARVVNAQKQNAPMLVVELPIPGGFAPEAGSLAKLVQERDVARYQVQAGKVLLYLRDLPAGARLQLPYALRATLPVKVTAPGARVYEYYAPERQGHSRPVALAVQDR